MKSACFWSTLALVAIILCLETVEGIKKSPFVSRVLSRESYESPSERRVTKKAVNTSLSTVMWKNLASVKCKVFIWIFV